MAFNILDRQFGDGDFYVGVEVNDKQAQEYFDYLGEKVDNLREPLTRAMLMIVIPGIEEQFDTEGSRSGGWEPITPKWDAYKLRHARYQSILMFDDQPPVNAEGRESGLRHYATDPENIKEIDSKEVEYHIDYRIAQYHQDGEGNNRVRPIVVWTTEDDDKMQQIMIDWMNDVIMRRKATGAISVAPRWMKGEIPWSPTGPGPGRFRPRPR